MHRYVNRTRGHSRNRRLIPAKGLAATIRSTSGAGVREDGGTGPVRSPGTATEARFAVIGPSSRQERPLRPLTRDGGPLAYTGQGAGGPRADRLAAAERGGQPGW